MRNSLAVLSLVVLLTACDKSPQLDNQMRVPISQESAMLGPQNFNQGWLFTEGDAPNFATVSYDDSSWQSLRLPHDWSVSHDFEKKWDGATAYLPGGMGWYRKHFVSPPNSADVLTQLNFDGVYNHSTVYVNGEPVGGEVNGYTPFTLDISEQLKPAGEENVIAVRVDRSRYIDSRWYPGAGIYRNVTLYQKPRLHIPVWGTYVTTPSITAERGEVSLDVTLRNTDSEKRTTTVSIRIVDTAGQTVAETHEEIAVPAGKGTVLTQSLTVMSPDWWSIENPNLYSVITELKKGGDVTDRITTPLGFRTIEFKPESGFYLNGEHTLIKGVNVHHDGGLVGAAVPEDVWRRRLLRLKEAGVNAIRMSHNPASTELMALCDELGLLVQAEIFDEWDNPKDKRLNQQERHDDEISRGYADWFQTHAEKDLRAAVLRDRNHPSLIMWSIGNEIEWTYPRYAAATGYFDMNAGGNYFFTPPVISPEEIERRFETSDEGEYVLAETAQKLSGWVKSLDTTRPVIANLILPSVSHISGYTDALDIIGYSYRRVIYDYGRRLFPEKMIMGTENVPQWHEWKAIIERPAIAGTFLWTGIDYMGEAHDGWPRKGVGSGLLDLAGFKKPSFHMFKTLWDDTPHVYLTTQSLDKSVYTLNDNQEIVEKTPGSWKARVWNWHDVERHWNYPADTLTVVEAYSNCETLTLYVNGESYGEQQLGMHADHIYKWSVPFSAGDIVAKGECGASDRVATTGTLSALQINNDKARLAVDEKSVSHIEVQLVDEAGEPITHTEAAITFDVPAGLRLLGVDNGWVNSVQPFQRSSVRTHMGRALAIVQGMKPGQYQISVKAEGTDISDVNIEVQ